MSLIATLTISTVVATMGVAAVDTVRRKARREQYIRSFVFPRGLMDKLLAVRPRLTARDQGLVVQALRQFFLVYLQSGYQRVAMPSQVVDDLWHEFILFTRDYHAFCEKAFGNFLHHTPAVKMGNVKADNEGLRRVWWYSCREEKMNPHKPARLPLLFAIDQKLGIENGFFYDLDCRRRPAAAVAASAGAVAATQCATDFSDRSVDGTLAGLGDRSSYAGSGCGGGGTHGGCNGGSADGGGASGCSGGCGGGCGGGS